ncbi:hypothetical protein QYM36_016273, partial [Artemia franciscana]
METCSMTKSDDRPAQYVLDLLIVARDSVEVAHDDEHIFLWCLVGDTLKLKVELFALFIASGRVRSIYLDD